MKQYKTIRVSDSVFNYIQDLQERRENFISTVERLVTSTKNPPYVIRAGAGKYCVEVAGNRREFNTEEPLTHVLRITEETFNDLHEMKGHPDEMYNTVMFRITAANMQAPATIPEKKNPSRKKTAIAPEPLSANSPESIPEKSTPAEIDKICPFCNEHFLTDKPEQIYCTIKHTKAAWARKDRAEKKAVKQNIINNEVD
jgi:hypothetical protein